MAHGVLRPTPYTAVLALAGWAAQPGIWHELDGRAAAAGIDPSDFPAHRWLNFCYAEMLTRLNVRDNEKPEAARKRFDGQLRVRAWQTPGSTPEEAEQHDPKAPWWWSQSEADQSTQVFMELARARGRI